MDTVIQEIEFTPAEAMQQGAPPAVAQQQPAAVSTGGDPFLMMIERAARDPLVDIDKMERLFRMKLDMEARAAKAAYLQALAEMQPKLPVITKHGVISKNEKDERGQKTGKQEAMTKYAKWEDVVEGITPILAAHGFSLSFRIAQPTEARVAVSGVLGHRDGHTEETTLALPIDSSGAKNNVQGWGSSVSYGKRYTALALLNISARGEDDDGGPSDDGVDGLAAPDALRNREGKLLNAYASDKAKSFTANAIQAINLSSNTAAVKDWRHANFKAPKGSNISPLAWLEFNAPSEFERVKMAYENVTGEQW